MPHGIIVGRTESGKTLKAKEVARQGKQRGRGILVFDPLLDPGWEEVADLHTADADEFLRVAKNPSTLNCLLFIDEAGETMGVHDKAYHWCATRSRHNGHSAIFISQRAQQIAPLVRNQCTYLWMFKQSLSDSKILADEFCIPELINGPALPQFEYYHVKGYKEFTRGRVDTPWLKKGTKVAKGGI